MSLTKRKSEDSALSLFKLGNKVRQRTSGLKEFVINTRVVICPSLWFVLVEGAMLKSLNYNRKVAVVDPQY